MVQMIWLFLINQVMLAGRFLHTTEMPEHVMQFADWLASEEGKSFISTA